jgi:hypothetical protein
MLFKNPVRTAKRTPYFTITTINWLTLFKEVIVVYSENHTQAINKKRSITDCQSRWFIYLPLGLIGLSKAWNPAIRILIKSHTDVGRGDQKEHRKKTTNKDWLTDGEPFSRLSSRGTNQKLEG